MSFTLLSYFILQDCLCKILSLQDFVFARFYICKILSLQYLVFARFCLGKILSLQVLVFARAYLCKILSLQNLVFARSCLFKIYCICKILGQDPSIYCICKILIRFYTTVAADTQRNCLQKADLAIGQIMSGINKSPLEDHFHNEMIECSEKEIMKCS